MQLSKRLREILIMMCAGWELGRSETWKGGWWLQKGGCGKGGECRYIHGRTNVRLLVKEGLIALNKRSFPTTKYHLTSKGYERINK